MKKLFFWDPKNFDTKMMALLAKMFFRQNLFLQMGCEKLSRKFTRFAYQIYHPRKSLTRKVVIPCLFAVVIPCYANSLKFIHVIRKINFIRPCLIILSQQITRRPLGKDVEHWKHFGLFIWSRVFLFYFMVTVSINVDN